jgi:hypothetical protein
MNVTPQRVIKIEEEDTLDAANERARATCLQVYGPEYEAHLAQAAVTFRNGFPSLEALYLVAQKATSRPMSRTGGNLPG